MIVVPRNIKRLLKNKKKKAVKESKPYSDDVCKIQTIKMSNTIVEQESNQRHKKAPHKKSLIQPRIRLFNNRYYFTALLAVH